MTEKQAMLLMLTFGSINFAVYQESVCAGLAFFVFLLCVVNSKGASSC